MPSMLLLSSALDFWSREYYRESALYYNSGSDAFFTQPCGFPLGGHLSYAGRVVRVEEVVLFAIAFDD